jgi:hypothetical protein
LVKQHEYKPCIYVVFDISTGFFYVNAFQVTERGLAVIAISSCDTKVYEQTDVSLPKRRLVDKPRLFYKIKLDYKYFIDHSGI